jgi:hypothetical protein
VRTLANRGNYCVLYLIYCFLCVLVCVVLESEPYARQTQGAPHPWFSILTEEIEHQKYLFLCVY